MSFFETDSNSNLAIQEEIKQLDQGIDIALSRRMYEQQPLLFSEKTVHSRCSVRLQNSSMTGVAGM